MAKAKNILVVGAGAVGVNAALILDKMGYNVFLVEKGHDIYAESAANTANIWHDSGLEYCHPSHTETGFFCIVGAAVNRFVYLYLTGFFSTKVCNDNGVKFSVSKNSAFATSTEFFDSYVPTERFRENAEQMRNYFSEKIFEPTRKYFYEKATQNKKIHEINEADEQRRAYEQAAQILGCTPESFTREVKTDNPNVTARYESVGGGINMPHIYAYQKACLRQSNVHQQFNATIESVTTTSDGRYNVILKNGKRIDNLDSIILSAGIGNPGLVNKIPNSKPSIRGTYFLNTMVYAKLKNKSEDTEQIMFTLQQKFGGMLACIDEKARYYAVYSPNPEGSQLASHLYTKEERNVPPKEWEELIKNDLDIKSDTVKNIIEQVSKIYPVLKDAEVVCARRRVVFNPHSKEENPDGAERRVRLPESEKVADGVVVTHSPKFTNAAAVAFAACDQAIESMIEKEKKQSKEKFVELPSLPKHEERGLGPLKLDFLKISETINFQKVPGVDINDAVRYARENDLPVSMIDKNAPQFSREKEDFREMVKNNFCISKL